MNHVSIPRFVDAEEFPEPGVYFLQETIHDGRTIWSGSKRPPETNLSREPRLYGWCGETNNRSKHARGVVRIGAANASGRAPVEPLFGPELRSALEELGHPDLMPRESAL